MFNFHRFCYPLDVVILYNIKISFIVKKTSQRRRSKCQVLIGSVKPCYNSVIGLLYFLYIRVCIRRRRIDEKKKPITAYRRYSYSYGFLGTLR